MADPAKADESKSVTPEVVADAAADGIEPAPLQPSPPASEDEEKAATHVKTSPEREPKPGDYIVRTLTPHANHPDSR
jgi:hypothetical protein